MITLLIVYTCTYIRESALKLKNEEEAEKEGEKRKYEIDHSL